MQSSSAFIPPRLININVYGAFMMQFLVKLLKGVFDFGPLCDCKAKRWHWALWMARPWGLFTVELSSPVTGDLALSLQVCSDFHLHCWWAGGSECKPAGDLEMKVSQEVRSVLEKPGTGSGPGFHCISRRKASGQAGQSHLAWMFQSPHSPPPQVTSVSILWLQPSNTEEGYLVSV